PAGLDEGLQFGEPLVADAADVVELVDGGEAAVLGAEGDDALGEDGADAGKLLELLRGRGVQVDPAAGGRGRSGGAGRGSARRGGCGRCSSPTRICSPSATWRARFSEPG